MSSGRGALFCFDRSLSHVSLPLSRSPSSSSFLDLSQFDLTSGRSGEVLVTCSAGSTTCAPRRRQGAIIVVGGVEHGGELRSSSSSSSSVSAPVPVFLLLLALPARGAGASEAEGAAEHPKSSFLKLRGAKSETEDEKKFPSGL